MTPMPDRSTDMGGEAKAFPKTSWTIIWEAAQDGAPQQQESVEKLARLYWRPVCELVSGSSREIRIHAVEAHN